MSDNIRNIKPAADLDAIAAKIAEYGKTSRDGDKAGENARFDGLRMVIDETVTHNAFVPNSVVDKNGKVTTKEHSKVSPGNWLASKFLASSAETDTWKNYSAQYNTAIEAAARHQNALIYALDTSFRKGGAWDKMGSAHKPKMQAALELCRWAKKKENIGKDIDDKVIDKALRKNAPTKTSDPKKLENLVKLLGTYVNGTDKTPAIATGDLWKAAMTAVSKAWAVDAPAETVVDVQAEIDKMPVSKRALYKRLFNQNDTDDDDGEISVTPPAAATTVTQKRRGRAKVAA